MRIYPVFDAYNHLLQGMSETKVEKIKVSNNTLFLNASEQNLVRRKRRRKFLSVILVLCAELHRELIYISLKQGSSFATGVEVQDRRKRVNIISTGSKSVDAIMGGNVPFSETPCVFLTLARRNHVPIDF